MNLGLDSLVKSNDLGMSNVSRIHFGFRFIVNPDPIIEYAIDYIAALNVLTNTLVEVCFCQDDLHQF